MKLPHPPKPLCDFKRALERLRNFDFDGVLISKTMWGLGYYRTATKNWQVRFIAAGPWRFRFIRPSTKVERQEYTFAQKKREEMV